MEACENLQNGSNTEDLLGEKSVFILFVSILNIQKDIFSAFKSLENKKYIFQTIDTCFGIIGHHQYGAEIHIDRKISSAMREFNR